LTVQCGSYLPIEEVSPQILRWRETTGPHDVSTLSLVIDQDPLLAIGTQILDLGDVLAQSSGIIRGIPSKQIAATRESFGDQQATGRMTVELVVGRDDEQFKLLAKRLTLVFCSGETRRLVNGTAGRIWDLQPWVDNQEWKDPILRLLVPGMTDEQHLSPCESEDHKNQDRGQPPRNSTHGCSGQRQAMLIYIGFPANNRPWPNLRESFI
jgi:hypothetical protein